MKIYLFFIVYNIGVLSPVRFQDIIIANASNKYMKEVGKKHVVF